MQTIAFFLSEIRLKKITLWQRPKRFEQQMNLRTVAIADVKFLKSRVMNYRLQLMALVQYIFFILN